MAKKKNTQIAVSQEDNTQAQHILEQYHEIAGNLHTSTDQKQAEDALTEINNMPEGVQIALLKALSKELHTDDADVLIAINELSPIKSVRKEAKRSLIRLEGARIYPQWKPPVQPAVVLQVTEATLRFWQGIVTDTLPTGEVELLLLFENEDNPREIRILGFLLEFWHDGVKDFFTRVESRRSVENFIAGTPARLPGIKTKNSSLTEGRRMLLDALAVNKQHGTVPHQDYRFNLSLINRLVLEAPDLEEDADLDEDTEESINLHDLKPEGVIINFVESWVNGQYDIAYDLLSSDSPVREGLSRDEWIERRDAWSDEANPGELEPNFYHEREPQESRLWLPNTVSAIRSATRKDIEVGWSIELEESSLSDTPPELPEATVIYEETGRHWFWTRYTLVQEQDEWRIQNISDEGANALGLSVAELQRRIQEHNTFLEEFAQKQRSVDREKAQESLAAIAWRVMQTIYYFDALIKQLSFDRLVYQEAASLALLFRQSERGIVYLELLIERFPEQRAENLRTLATVQIDLSQKYFDRGDDELAKRSQERAEEALRESLAIQDSFAAHMSMAELLINMNERLDEAEDHLLQIKTMTTDPADQAHIALHLGQIAMVREQYKEALSQYQRFAEHNSNSPDAWFNVAEAHKMLKNFEEADANYRRALSLQPDDEEIYFVLSQMYSGNDQLSKAIDVIEEGLSANPDSVFLTISLATLYLENQDLRQAEIFLEKAERIDPELQSVLMFRQILNLAKNEQFHYINRPNRPKLNKPKKKRH